MCFPGPGCLLRSVPAADGSRSGWSSARASPTGRLNTGAVISTLGIYRRGRPFDAGADGRRTGPLNMSPYFIFLGRPIKFRGLKFSSDSSQPNQMMALKSMTSETQLSAKQINYPPPRTLALELALRRRPPSPPPAPGGDLPPAPAASSCRAGRLSPAPPRPPRPVPCRPLCPPTSLAPCPVHHPRRAGGLTRPLERGRPQRGDGLRKMERESGQLGGSRHCASAAAHLGRSS